MKVHIFYVKIFHSPFTIRCSVASSPNPLLIPYYDMGRLSSIRGPFASAYPLQGEIMKMCDQIITFKC